LLFSSIGFLYYFLPVTLILYFILPAPGGSPRFRNLFLLLASLVFYAWGEPGYVFLMIAQCGSAWFLGLCIDRYRGRAKALMMVSVSLSLSGLLFFKYADFFIQNLNRLTGGGIAPLRVALPIGISFYSFQIISYTLDLYRNRIEVQRNFFDFSAYVALFPQLIAGPIVRYADIARPQPPQSQHRQILPGRPAFYPRAGKKDPSGQCPGGTGRYLQAKRGKKPSLHLALSLRLLYAYLF